MKDFYPRDAVNFIISLVIERKGLYSNANGSYMSFTRVLILEIGLNKYFDFLDRKRN